jgi:hypothetical protein
MSVGTEWKYQEPSSPKMHETFWPLTGGKQNDLRVASLREIIVDLSGLIFYEYLNLGSPRRKIRCLILIKSEENLWGYQRINSK